MKIHEILFLQGKWEIVGPAGCRTGSASVAPQMQRCWAGRPQWQGRVGLLVLGQCLDGFWSVSPWHRARDEKTELDLLSHVYQDSKCPSLQISILKLYWVNYLLTGYFMPGIVLRMWMGCDTKEGSLCPQGAWTRGMQSTQKPQQRTALCSEAKYVIF